MVLFELNESATPLGLNVIKPLLVYQAVTPSGLGFRKDTNGLL